MESRTCDEVDADLMGKVDRARQTAEVALNAGREAQSPQTGFFHLFYGKSDQVEQMAIPLLENFAYALALMRDRTKEGVHEGKKLLERLLFFQNVVVEERKNLFPLYLHEFPECRDPFSFVAILPYLYWILADFGTVLGSLTDKLKKVVRELLAVADELRAKTPLPLLIQLKLAAAEAGFGRLWGDDQLANQGLERLEALRSQTLEESFVEWFKPENIAETLIALQMSYPTLSDCPWAEFGSWLVSTWHQPTGSYIGPCIAENQEGSEPEVTLYDLFLGFYTGSFSFRSLVNRPTSVLASVVHASEDRLYPLGLPYELRGRRGGHDWLIRQQPNLAYSLISYSGTHERSSFCPLKVIWGSKNLCHSLVCSLGNAKKIAFTEVANGVDLFFTLPEEVPTEAKQRNREVSFYVNRDEATQLTIGQDKVGTAFPLGEAITVQHGSIAISLRFCLQEGQGRFFGHIALGNRPGQQANRGVHRFAVFDWHLFLRTLDRSSDCTIRVEVRFR